ncbi:hypothetical protein MTO96_035180 [Rhipicephalus appendiculatus]
MTTLSLCGIFALIFSLLQMYPANAQNTIDCSPTYLQTHGKQILVGCMKSCGNERHTAVARQSGVECTNLTTDVANNMQKYLGYMCPVGLRAFPFRWSVLGGDSEGAVSKRDGVKAGADGAVPTVSYSFPLSVCGQFISSP